ncbi:MAG TPA: asparagine synthetase B, partial [Planctomycetota bacterium]|nr:asparagine synthetase B [Planctomycetota bacterium]
MCGIAGAVVSGRLELQVLQRMADTLAHRGPDGAGTVAFDPFEAGAGTWQAGLAHRRLSIFDPTPSGAQPMTSRSGRTTLVLNGEIYNHPELRSALPGFRWRTRSDTEVLLELLEARGLAVLPQLNGMFSFAAWDACERRLLLVRDPVGIKPLYVRAAPDALVFGSELSAVLAGPAFARRIDSDALATYLDLGFVPGPRTIAAGVRKLAPGTWLEWRDGRARARRWFQLPPPASEPPRGWRDELRTALEDAVRLQLRADVPVGAFLSGGLDSTLISALAVRRRGDLLTFAARFPDCPLL